MKQSMLIADGNAELCDLYRRFSTGRGYEVETTSDGLDCVRQLRQLTPAVLVLALELRWGGGDGVLGWLREEPQFFPHRVVLTSTEASAPNLNRLASPPAVKTLTKPFPLSALLDDTASVALAGSTHPSTGGLRRGILVVDNEPADRNSLQTFLQNHGFHVWTADSGEEALDRCCDHGQEIMVILLDLETHGLNGRKILEGIRAYDVEIPVCFMTGNPGDLLPSDLLQQGASHLFAKPLRMDEIVRVECDLVNEPMGWPQEN
jgi:CheY-like chemotaxis protein